MTVRAENFFSDDGLPHQQIANVLSGFQQLAGEINGATLKSAVYEGRKDGSYRERRHLFATSFKGVFSRMNALLDVVREAIQDVREADAFFRHNSLSVLVEWANSHAKIKQRFKVSGRGIVEDDPMRLFGTPPAATLPNSFMVPSVDGLEAFVAAVNAGE
jgi:hypothetical protein